ncbi:tyrosine--tRNA ligase, partial [bacterium]|nr:tyrosine--tRNA ligase [bacterium]
EDMKLMLSQMKMSKSKPDSAVFIHDSEDDIRRKIMKAFAPEAEIKFNPILDWTKHLIFTRESEILIKREKQHGGDLHVSSYDELEKLYADKKLFPLDLKNFVADYLVKLLKPIREHFASGKPKQMLEELENKIK